MSQSIQGIASGRHAQSVMETEEFIRKDRSSCYRPTSITVKSAPLSAPSKPCKCAKLMATNVQLSETWLPEESLTDARLTENQIFLRSLVMPTNRSTAEIVFRIKRLAANDRGFLAGPLIIGFVLGAWFITMVLVCMSK